MLRYFNADQKNSITKLEFILDSRKSRQQNKSNNVKKILSDVKKFGDKALIKYEKKFSRKIISPKRLKFSKDEINKISKNVDKELKKSINLAFLRIKKFHFKQ